MKRGEESMQVENVCVKDREEKGGHRTGGG